MCSVVVWCGDGGVVVWCGCVVMVVWCGDGGDGDVVWLCGVSSFVKLFTALPLR